MGGMLQLLLRPTPHGWEGIGLQQQVPGRGNWLQIICPLDRTAGNAEPAVLEADSGQSHLNEHLHCEGERCAAAQASGERKQRVTPGWWRRCGAPGGA